MRWVLLLVVVVAPVVLGWHRYRRRHDRQRQLMLLCEAAGLEFAPVDMSIGTAWLPFEVFGRTPSGTSNVVWDPRHDGGVRAFDFWYEEPGSDRPLPTRRTITCAVVPLGFTCPRIRVAPRDLVDDVADAVGLRLVTLELEEFNDRFRVEAEDARAASALLDQRVMEGFLRLPHGVVADVNEEVLLFQCLRAAGRGDVAAAAGRELDPTRPPAGDAEPVPGAPGARRPRASLAPGTLEPRAHRNHGLDLSQGFRSRITTGISRSVFV